MATCSHPRKILRMPPDSFTSALGELDPASRALLDLSLRRGMRTEEIADMLGAEPWNVALSRDQALRRVAESVGMTGEEQLDEVRARLPGPPAGGGGGRRRSGGGGWRRMGMARSRRRRLRRRRTRPPKKRPRPACRTRPPPRSRLRRSPSA